MKRKGETVVLVDASQARKLTHENLSFHSTEELKEISYSINVAISEGRFEVYLPYRTLTPETRKALLILGYEVEQGGRYNEIDTKIEW